MKKFQLFPAKQNNFQQGNQRNRKQNKTERNNVLKIKKASNKSSFICLVNTVWLMIESCGNFIRKKNDRR
jgi:hypothetical protein